MDRDLKARIDQHPYGALAAALSAGYVLGGGLFTRLTERIAKPVLKAGIRAAVFPFLAERVTELLTPGEKKETASTSPPAERTAPPRQDAA